MPRRSCVSTSEIYEMRDTMLYMGFEPGNLGM